MQVLLEITKALADASRLRALMLLQGSELCLCHLTEILGLSPSTVSRHMSLLVRAGLVEARKDGRWRYFRLPPGARPAAVRDALRLVLGHLEGDPVVAADAKRLEAYVDDAGVLACRVRKVRVPLTAGARGAGVRKDERSES